MLKTDEFVWLNVNCLNLSIFLHVFSETAKSSESVIDLAMAALV